MYQASTRPSTLPVARPIDRSVDNRGSRDTFQYLCKRGMDILFVLTSLICVLPILTIIAILIKLDSPGPVFFKQERVGARRRKINGKTVWETHNFVFYKFRSMAANADQSVHEAYIKAFVNGEVAASDDADAQFKLNHDPRVTRVGDWLRRTSLDELPQLINIWKGEMSLVGPRPVPGYEVAGYQERHYQRFAALPGLTGLWQVTGRGQVTFEEMIALDLDYVRKQSLWFDLKILLMTIPAVLLGKGAK